MAPEEQLTWFEPPKLLKTYRTTETGQGHHGKSQKTTKKSRKQKVVEGYYVGARTTPSLQYEFTPDPYGQNRRGHQ